MNRFADIICKLQVVELLATT